MNHRRHNRTITTAIAADEVQIKTTTPPKSTMTRLALLFGSVVLAGGAVAAFTVSSNGGVAAPAASTSTSTVSRRDFVAKSAAAGAAVALPKAVVADDAAADPYADYVTSESGMRYLITKEGDGAVPSAGQLVKVRSFTIQTDTFYTPAPNLRFDYPFDAFDVRSQFLPPCPFGR